MIGLVYIDSVGVACEQVAPTEPKTSTERFYKQDAPVGA